MYSRYFLPDYNWDLDEITEPEMVSGFVAVINNHSPQFLPGNKYFTGSTIVANLLMLNFKPVDGITPKPKGGFNNEDLVEFYGHPMQEMIQRLRTFRAEKARQIFTQRASEIVKIEWVSPASDNKRQRTQNPQEINVILSELRNVDEHSFAYGQFSERCPIKVTFRDGTSSIIAMEVAENPVNPLDRYGDPKCPQWLRNYRRKLSWMNHPF